MTIKEIKEYVKDELNWQIEIANSDGEIKINREFIRNMKSGVLNCLHLDGKITNEQYNKMLKYYKLED